MEQHAAATGTAADPPKGGSSPALLYVIGFLADIGAGIVVLALPYAAKRLGAEVGVVGLVGGAYMGCYALGCLAGGAFIDRLRPRGVVLVGQWAQAAVALAIGLTDRQDVLIVLTGLYGALMVTIWPPVLSWLSHGYEGAPLNRRLAWFNVSWCSGLVIGPLIGGYLYEWNPFSPFVAAAVVLAVSGLLALLVTEPQPRPHRAHEQRPPLPAGFVPRPDAALFRFMARVSIVVCVAMAGMQRFQVPSLATSLGISVRTFGAIMLLMSLGNMACFVVLGRTHRWHYRASILWGAQVVLAVATASLVFARGPWLLAAVAVATGVSGGIAYSSSLYYGVSGGRRRGALAAIHEMLLSGGFVIGAIGSGALSQRFELQTPYPVSAAVLLLAVAVQVAAYGVFRTRGKPQG